ncbi:MAG: mannose-6-phosphate isomerase [Bacteroides sp.]|nr:mannose-6-phosphate isomerase [Bacteroidales bacterium]MBD5379647.1 mannose-6-phosphate isomerase [Bacteroides sp.]
MKELHRILSFRPQFSSVIWGGDRIGQYKGIELPGSNIGESWEISGLPGAVSVVDGGEFDGMSLTRLVDIFGESFLGKAVAAAYPYTGFPLLIKFIDAHHNLSLQVHPGEELARRCHGCNGKDEMWYVIDSNPGAKILCGLNQKMTPELFDKVVAENNLIDYIASYDSKKGQVYYIPSGTIHAIGEGNLILEVQQSSNITYRIFDYNRRDNNGQLRPLHIKEAREAIDYSYSEDNVNGKSECNISSNYFKANVFNVKSDAPVNIVSNGDSFTIVVVIEGNVVVTTQFEKREFKRGSTFLLSADLATAEISGNATIMKVTV